VFSTRVGVTEVIIYCSFRMLHCHVGKKVEEFLASKSRGMFLVTFVFLFINTSCSDVTCALYSANINVYNLH
jgi:hypothetical protein